MAGDFVAVVKEITQSVKHLRFREIQGVGDFQDGLAAQVEGSDMAHRDAQAVNNRFAAAHAVAVNNVGMLGFEKCFHGVRRRKGSGYRIESGPKPRRPRHM